MVDIACSGCGRRGIVASVENPRGRRHGHETCALFPRAIEVSAWGVARNREKCPGRPFEARHDAAIVAQGCRSATCKYEHDLFERMALREKTCRRRDFTHRAVACHRQGCRQHEGAEAAPLRPWLQLERVEIRRPTRVDRSGRDVADPLRVGCFRFRSTRRLAHAQGIARPACPSGSQPDRTRAHSRSARDRSDPPSGRSC